MRKIIVSMAFVFSQRRFRPLFFLLFSSFLTSHLHAATTEWKTNPNGQVRLIVADDSVLSKGTVLLGFHFKTAPGWYVYWKVAGDAGYPPSVKWDGTEGLKEPTFLFPFPTRFNLPGNITEFGYEGEVVYPVKASVMATGKDVHLSTSISYLTCNTACVPYKYDFSIDLPVGKEEPDPEPKALIERFFAQVPPSDETDEAIERSAPTVLKNPILLTETPVATAPVSTGGLLLLAFLGGLLLNVMPCVLPVLSIKLLGLIQHSGQARSKIMRNSLASATGIMVSFLAIAVAAIFARRAGIAVGWGIQFQQPVFVGFMAAVVFLFALNLWGAFEINIPTFIGHFATSYGWGESVGAYFMSGLFATILATPCSAPFLGTAMGFALSQPAGVVLMIFAAVGTGMALPYFLLVLFPHSLHYLPKPGIWMVKIRLILGIILFMTALWLVSILLAQIGHPIWRPAASTSSSSMALPWVPFDEGEISHALAEGKSVFVDVTAAWCVTCKYNERFVLSDSEVSAALRKQGLVMMQADWTSHDAAITAFLQKYGRAGIPFYALYRPGKSPVLLSEFLTKAKVLEALNQ